MRKQGILEVTDAQASQEIASSERTTSFRFFPEFIETVLCLDPDVHGFTGPDIATVEVCWGARGVKFHWAGGFIVKLRDGRRAYLASDCATSEDWEGAGSIEVEMLTEDAASHIIASLQSMAWEEPPVCLNEFLGLLRP